MKKQPDPVTFNPDTLREFTAVYDKAVAGGKESFTYQGREYVVRYAYYLIQFLKERFNG